MSDHSEHTRRYEAGTSPEADLVELADFYRYLADAEFAGYCELYAGLAREVAEDPELLGTIASFGSRAKVLPVLVNAAVHDLLLAEPDQELAAVYRGEAPAELAWPLFRALVLARSEDLHRTVASRTIQTNEVGRSSILLPALTAVHRLAGRPLALIELGPSAGLNLAFDRYGYHYDNGVGAGAADSPVQLTCAVRGSWAPPIGETMPPIASRVGIDISPIDVRDEVACRWLEACIWPLVPDRAARLRAAIGVARADPPPLRRGHALELLPEVIAEVPADVVPVVATTWVLAYFSSDERKALGALLDDVGGRRDLAGLTSEYPGVAPWIDPPGRDATDNAGQAASLLGLRWWHGGHATSVALAWTHAHGQWIDWLDPATATA